MSVEYEVTKWLHSGRGFSRIGTYPTYTAAVYAIHHEIEMSGCTVDNVSDDRISDDAGNVYHIEMTTGQVKVQR